MIGMRCWSPTLQLARTTEGTRSNWTLKTSGQCLRCMRSGPSVYCSRSAGKVCNAKQERAKCLPVSEQWRAARSATERTRCVRGHRFYTDPATVRRSEQTVKLCISTRKSIAIIFTLVNESNYGRGKNFVARFYHFGYSKAKKSAQKFIPELTFILNPKQKL